MSTKLVVLDDELSNISLYPDAVNLKTSKVFFSTLSSGVSWKQETLILFGKNILTPRLSAWYGDTHYSFSGLKMHPNPLTSELQILKKFVQSVTGEKFNSVLINLYRNGKDSISWHSDDEPELGKNPSIASVSFGGERKFSLRHKINKEKKISVFLPNGSLLVMSGKTQTFWQHALLKTRKNVPPRINLTFRFVYNTEIS